MNLSSSTSTNTVPALQELIASTVAKNVFGTVITSSPSPIPSARRSEPKRVCLIAHADGVLGATGGRELPLKIFHERSACKCITLDYSANSLIELVDQGTVTHRQIKKGNAHLRLCAFFGFYGFPAQWSRFRVQGCGSIGFRAL